MLLSFIRNAHGGGVEQGLQFRGALLHPVFQLLVDLPQALLALGQLAVGAGEFPVAALDGLEHGVEGPDQGAHLVVAGALGPEAVVLLLADVPGDAGELLQGPRHQALQPRGDEGGGEKGEHRDEPREQQEVLPHQGQLPKARPQYHPADLGAVHHHRLLQVQVVVQGADLDAAAGPLGEGVGPLLAAVVAGEHLAAVVVDGGGDDGALDLEGVQGFPRHLGVVEQQGGGGAVGDHPRQGGEVFHQLVLHPHPLVGDEAARRQGQGQGAGEQDDQHQLGLDGQGVEG